MKKRYIRPEIQSDDCFEQTANQTGPNVEGEERCRIIGVNPEGAPGGCPGEVISTSPQVGCSGFVDLP